MKVFIDMRNISAAKRVREDTETFSQFKESCYELILQPDKNQNGKCIGKIADKHRQIKTIKNQLQYPSVERVTSVSATTILWTMEKQQQQIWQKNISRR